MYSCPLPAHGVPGLHGLKGHQEPPSEKERDVAADTLEIRRLSGALGAEITGVNLAHDLADATIARIRQAFVEHQVIFSATRP